MTDAMDGMIVSPKFIFEALTPNVTVFGGGDLGLAEVMRGAPMMGLVPLLEEKGTRALCPVRTQQGGHLQMWTWALTRYQAC